MTPDIKTQIKTLPNNPGIYIFRDQEGTVLYIGKAKNLRNRVRQYFTGKHNARTALYVPLISTIETIISENEKEALLLESTLIKRHRPRFNIDMKDDKSYPYFRITLAEEFPRLELTRTIKRDKSLYFGPFTDAGSARSTLSYLKKAFPLRRCVGIEPGGRSRRGRTCIDHEIGRCPGPCGDEITPEQYRKTVQELLEFLKGRGRTVIAELNKEMKLLSGNTQFEAAAVIRDRIKAIESVMETQNVVGDPRDEMDVVGFASSGDLSALTCIFVRSGLIVGRYDLGLKGLYSAEEAIDAFIGDYYRKGVSIPPLILFPVGLDFAPAHAEILSELCGRSVRLRHPLRGKKVKLLKMAAENAAHALKATVLEENTGRSLIAELKRSMKLDKMPKRIECLDISHTSGKYTIGGIVVWQEGSFRRDQYRLFSIRNSAKPGDDFRAIDEVIKRRFAGSVSNELPDPDLLLIDGGKGQLSAATAAIDELDMSGGWSTAAISKSRQARKLGQPGAADEVFIPDRLNPVHFRKNSKSYQVLRQIRDEAHRFTVTAHRKKRGKENLFSILERVEGIGPARRKALLTNFRSIEEIRDAEPDEIARLKGFNHELAERVKEILK